MGKVKVGELYRKSIVEGNKNLIDKKSEIHISEVDGGGSIDIEQLLWFSNGYHAAFIIDFDNKTINFTMGDNGDRQQVEFPGYDIAVNIKDGPRDVIEFQPISGSYKIYTADGVEIPRVITPDNGWLPGLKSAYLMNWSDLGEYPISFVVKSLTSNKEYKLLFFNNYE